MAIGYIRVEHGNRKSGLNACGKSAYNSRSKIEFYGNKYQGADLYDFSWKEKPVYQKVLLPEWVDEIYQKPEILWNHAEQKELRTNSQIYLDVVLALPDDKIISIEDRIQLCEIFAKEHFTSKGLAVQIDIHSPETRKNLTEEELEYGNPDHNWHAHLLVTTRRFTPDGKELCEKARDLMPVILKGKMVATCGWGPLWIDCQNAYFESKGMSLRVDPFGIVSQTHLGPVRMRAKGFPLSMIQEEHDQHQAMNQQRVLDPKSILEALLKRQSVFTKEEAERFLNKHITHDMINSVSEAFWKQEGLVTLLDKETKKPVDKYTSLKVIEEEGSIIKLTERIRSREPLNFDVEKSSQEFASNLTEEQSVAFRNILVGRGLNCVEGHAGTGKSFLMVALKNAYEKNGFSVRALGPDNATCKVFLEKGFTSTENLHSFLYATNGGKRKIKQGHEIWIIDESSKISNKLLTELLKTAEKYQARIILSGCSAQFNSIERGGMFSHLCKRYGAELLQDIQRQQMEEQRNIAKQLALGEFGKAIDEINVTGGFRWTETKEEAMQEVIKGWAAGRLEGGTSIIIAYQNEDVARLNDMAHEYRKQKGELGKEFSCKSFSETIKVSVGDKIEFRDNNKELEVTNGLTGTLIKGSSSKFTVLTDEQTPRKISFDPTSFTKFQLGYATTYFRSQGGTFTRAYVYFTKHMNKPGFYVGSTRHKLQAYLFIPEEEARNLSHLKWQALRPGYKEATLDFVSKETIELEQRQLEVDRKQQEKQQARKAEIQELIESPSFISKIKGYTFGTWDSLQSKIQERTEKAKLVQPDPTFYSYEKTETRQRPVEVKEIPSKTPMQQPLSIAGMELHPESVASKLINFFKHPETRPSEMHEVGRQDNLSKDISESWSILADEYKDLFRSYYNSINEAINFQEAIKAHASFLTDQEENSPYFSEWLDACEKRDSFAYRIAQSLHKNEIRKFLGNQAGKIIEERASSYEKILQTQEQVAYDGKLKNYLADLLTQHLFTGQPVRLDQKYYRVGPSGTLLVTAEGEHLGKYYDLETKQGGGPFKLIQEALGLDHQQCVEWSKSFLQVKGVTVDKEEAKKDWVSLIPPHDAKVPPLEQIKPWFAKNYHLLGQYPYYNERGQLLFYIYKMSSKKDHTIINLPISYGYFKGQSSEVSHWNTRGYIILHKPLYRLHHVLNNPSATVLLVDGEDNVEAASKMFPSSQIVSSTWFRSPGSIRKSDWTLMKGRDVVIWPSNSPTGYGISRNLAYQLRRVGVNSYNVVDLDILRKEFPQNWSLAQRLPTFKKEEDLYTLIQNAKDSSLRLSDLITQHGSKLKRWGKTPAILHLRMNDIVSKVEQRYDKDPSKRSYNTQQMKMAVTQEIEKMFDKYTLRRSLAVYKAFPAELKKSFFSLSLWYHSVTGEAPTPAFGLEIKRIMTSNLGDMQRLKKVLAETMIELQPDNGKLREEIRDYAFDKALARMLEITMIKKQPLENVYLMMSRSTSTIAKQLCRQFNKEYALQEAIKQREADKPDPALSKVQATLNPLIQENQLPDNKIQLDKKQKAILDDYFQCAEHVFKLQKDIKVKDKGENSPELLQMKKESGKRNELAFTTTQTIEKKDLEELLDRRSYDLLCQRAARYESYMQEKAKNNRPELESKLRENLDPLVARLFPDGPKRRDSKGYRFGSKGSLVIFMKGERAGSFYDHEHGVGGGLLNLIERTLLLKKKEAIEWAKDFLGESRTISSTHSYFRPDSTKDTEKEWISLRPDSNHLAPSFSKICYGLSLKYQETARYAYRDEKGELLFYTLRLVEKENPSRKIVLPLSYGHAKGGKEAVSWTLKAYSTHQRPLYNLHLINEKPEATILVVEGEKTADAALDKFSRKDMLVLTWLGGAAAVAKTDWSPLAGRNVLIWPDNDKAGYKAASDICTELRKLGVQSMKVVDSESLKQHFPEKWDLADPMPKGVSDSVPEKLLATALEKSIDTEKVMHRLSLDPKDPVLKARLTEILWRVDERMRPDLEEKHGVQYWKAHEEIVKEAARIFSDQDKRRGEIKEKFGIDGIALERLNYQMAICEAELGRKPRTSEINTLKLVIKEHGYMQTPKIDEKGVSEIAVDKMLSNMCSHALQGVPVEKVASAKSEKALTQTINEVQQQIRQDLVIQSDQKKTLGKETGNSLRI